jgi:hypothetical protein
MKQPAKTFQATPENVGKENSLYPPSLEKFWHVYEGDFIRAAGGLDGHGQVWLRANRAGTPRATA